MLQSITRIISIITVVQLLLFAVFLLNHKKGNRTSNITLSAFLFSNALFIINFLLSVFRNSLPSIFIHFHLVGYPFVFLFGPLLYFYTKILTEKNFRYKRADIYHFLPFFLILLYIFFTFEIHTAKEKQQLIAGGEAISKTAHYFFTVLMNLQVFTYLILSLKLLQEYRLEIRKYFSSIENFNLTWLSIVIFGFAVMWLIDLVHFIVTPVINGNTHNIFGFFSLLTNFIFANIIIYKGLQHPEVLLGFDDRTEAGRYGKSSLSFQEKERYLKELQIHMDKEKPYLNPSLTIKELSAALKISTRHLSQIINESLDKNFYDFVNGYRIEEAKRILADTSNKKKTVLEILYEVGFNSKSSFNAAFSKVTGTTPSEFKKLYRY